MVLGKRLFVVSHQSTWRHVMKTITRFLKRVFDVVRRFFGQATSLLWKLLAMTVTLVRRGNFALPHDDVERLEVLHFIYKALNVVLVLAVLAEMFAE
jgi:hypothetical protein